MNSEIAKELFKLVSSLDKDWNGSENSKNALVRFLTKNQECIADSYIEAAFDCIAEYDEIKLHLLRHQLINEILIDENKEKRKYFVYKHTVPNGKVYIGVTCCATAELRWFDGLGYAKNIPFYEDIRKYGWNNILHEIIYKNLLPEAAKAAEIELIKQYNSTDFQYGYNRDDGGRISTTPYIWKTWSYDINYQSSAKRRPFKIILDHKDLAPLKKFISKFDGEIIECKLIDKNFDQHFVVASNPSYKEKRIRGVIKTYLYNNSSDIQVEYLYGAIDGSPFEFDVKKQKLIVRVYLIDKTDYKLENIMEDLRNILA